jgi:hypothetical protein
VKGAAFFVVFGFTTAAVVAGWGYHRRYTLVRPPIGVISLGDIAVVIAATVAAPYLYLALPLPVVSGLYILGVVFVLYTVGEPVFPARWALWVAVLLLVGTDVGVDAWLRTASLSFLLVNNAVMTLVVVGVANLWAQGGTKARDVGVLAVALAIYDFIATTLLPVTTDLYGRLGNMPLTPMLAWGSGRDRLSLGLGDAILATVFPLVMRKAFGRRAGLLAAALTLCAIAALSVAVEVIDTTVAIPVMVALGPLMVVQYRYWIGHRGAERTTWQYVRDEPPGTGLSGVVRQRPTGESRLLRRSALGHPVNVVASAHERGDGRDGRHSG